ncbi:PDC sensor domain-containing protein [Cohnella hashimotonis]|uniref:Cache domain-containing protein n=1 Tax=Cohnella hashimotonis TaxID=2826895 RepID=A0ABT6TCH6_9BACL|nr:hypothetical protein [Cohnella hashimotonis]MDI4644542.1 hypothetical protein [Cohnella hashimotonis]
MAEKLDHYMWSRAGEINVVGTLDVINNPSDPVAIQRVLESLQTHIPSFTWVGFTDSKGNVIASTGGILKGKNVAQRPVFQNGIKGTFIGDVHEAVLLAKLLPNPSGDPLEFVDISIPVTDDSGATVGVLATHLSWEWSKEVSASILQPLMDRNSYYDIFIVSKNDNTILLGPEQMVGTRLDIPGLSAAQEGKNSYATVKWPAVITI